MKTFFQALLLTVALVAVVRSCSPLLGLQSPLIGESAPDFTLKTVGGQSVRLSDDRRGRPTILYFWATWCPHCRTELRELAQNVASISSQGIKVWAIDLEESAGQVRDFLNSANISMDVLLDTEGTVAEDYKIVGIPSYFVIDRRGVVVKVSHRLPGDYQSLLSGAGP